MDHIFVDKKVLEILRASGLFTFDADNMTIYQFFEDLEVGLADTIFSRNSDGQYSLVAQQNGYPTDTKFATFAKGNGGGATDDDTNTVDSDDDEVQLLKLDNDQQQRYITVLSNCEYDEELAKPSVSWNQTHVDSFLAYIASGSTPATAVKKVVEDIKKSTTTAGGDGLDDGVANVTTTAKTNEELQDLDDDQKDLFDSIASFATTETLDKVKEMVQFIQTCEKAKFKAFVSSLQESGKKKNAKKKDLSELTKIYNKIKS
jgi:hypothetical protein